MGVKRPRICDSPDMPTRECDDIDTPRFGHEDRMKLGSQPAPKVPKSAGILKRIGMALLGGKSNTQMTDDSDNEDDDASSELTTSPDQGSLENAPPHSVQSVDSRRSGDFLVNPLTLQVADVDEATGVPSFCFLPDFASETLGGRVIYATDEFYGLAENLLKPADQTPVGQVLSETPFGKIRDAWLPRRRRTPGHEFCIIELAETAHLRGFDIDIACLPEACPRASVEGGSFIDLVADLRHYLEERQSRHLDPALLGPPETPSNRKKKMPLAVRSTLMSSQLPQTFYKDMESFLEQKEWFEILPVNNLTEGHNWFAISPSSDEDRRVSHLRLNLFPDGGVARFRAYGETIVALPLLRLLEAESSEHSLNFLNPCLGGWPLWASSNRWMPLAQTVLQTPAKSYSEGWCSARLPIRPPAVFASPEESPSFFNSESVLYKLTTRGSPKELLFDTAYHVGDAPFAITVEVVDCPHILKVSLLQQIEFFKLAGGENLRWTPILQNFPVSPHCIHKISFTTRKTRLTRTGTPEAVVDVLSPDSRADPQGIEYTQISQRVCLEEPVLCTHMRLRLVPDGGFARVALYCGLLSAAEAMSTRSHSENAFSGSLSAKRRTAAGGGSRRRSSALFHSLRDGRATAG